MTVPTRLTELMHAVLDGEASESEIRDLELRLAADPAARAEFDEWKVLFQALSEMPKEYAPEGLVAAVTRAVPEQAAGSAAAGQPFSPRGVLGYTSTRISGARLGQPGAIPPPTSHLRSVSMTQQSRFFATRKGWLGAGIVAAAAVVVAQLGFDFPVAKDVMGTVAPAQRYRAAPNGSENVQLAPTATPGAATGTAPEANRAIAERTDAQMTAERNAQMAAERNVQMTAERNAQMTAERNAQMTAERNAQMTAERNAQMTAERNAQMTAERNAQMTAERNAQMTAERNAQMTAERNAQAQKSTNRTAQP